MSHFGIPILAFYTNFCPNKSYLSCNTVWPQVSGIQKLAKMDYFLYFIYLLSTQNVNVARFARKSSFVLFGCLFVYTFIRQLRVWWAVNLRGSAFVFLQSCWQTFMSMLFLAPVNRRVEKRFGAAGPPLFQITSFALLP